MKLPIKQVLTLVLKPVSKLDANGKINFVYSWLSLARTTARGYFYSYTHIVFSGQL